MKKLYWFLAFIVLLAAFLRFFHLGTNPVSLTWDEVAWGYNAYTLGLNGHDEFGRFLPLQYLESFGDFKPPVYAYLSILPVMLFGLTEFATRFTSAFFGTLTVLITFFLARKIFAQTKYQEYYALTTALLLAISPWHINLSRAAFEANVSTFFIITGVWLFLEWVDGKRKSTQLLLLTSILSFCISLYTFNTARIVSPLLGLLLVGVFWKKLLKHWKLTIVAGIFAGILLLPLVPFLLSSQGQLRYREVNIFSDISVIKQTNQEVANDGNVWWSKILHNRRFAYAQLYLQHYFDNLSPNFLFIQGDGNPKFSTQDLGQLYLIELPFLILGILFLFKNRERHWWLLPVWLLLGIIPAATARETPHALRIETTLPTFQLLVAYGFVQVIEKIQYKKVVIGIVSGLLFLNMLYYLHGYYIHYPQEYASEWQYGYKEAIAYTESVKGNYDSICFTEELGRPYMYVLFYGHYKPDMLQQNSEITRDPFGFVTVKQMGKYTFGSEKDCGESKNILYVNTKSNVSDKAHIQKTFYLPNHEVALVAYTK
jgi:4-amino-4-deoxy-L-arabinose transferase-like glycosyltransferase